MEITIVRDSSYAPCCFILCALDDSGNYDPRDDSRTILVQLDWDYPAIASAFGWQPCQCGATDGTIDCPHRTASEMIQDAGAWLDQHAGEIVDDPGYFISQ